MCIFNAALDGMKEHMCSGENAERKEARHNTTQQGMTRGCLIKVKLEGGVQRC